MNKMVYLISGVVLAGVGAAGFWALSTNSPQENPVQVESKKISLLTINYIPTSPVKIIEDGKYWEISQSSDTQPVEKNLKNLTGKPVILHFWATWCGPCVKELPLLDEFAKKYKNAVVLAVATDAKDISKIRNFYKTKNIENLSINFDKKGMLSRFFRPSALPTTVFINSKGEEIGRISGIVEWDGLPGRLLNTYLSKN